MPLSDLLKLPDFRQAINCQNCDVWISNDATPQFMTTPPGYAGPIDRSRWTHTKIYPVELAN